MKGPQACCAKPLGMQIQQKHLTKKSIWEPFMGTTKSGQDVWKTQATTPMCYASIDILTYPDKH